MEKTNPLECRVVKELDNWPRGRLSVGNTDGKTYSGPFAEFTPRTEISCGKSEFLEIHVGNKTWVYFEECRFKPVKLIILATPNLQKEDWPPNHCNHVDFYTHGHYQHPDGTLYSNGEIPLYSDGIMVTKKIPLQVPLDYKAMDLISIPKANKLLKRNSEVLEEINTRLVALNEIKEKIIRYKS